MEFVKLRGRNGFLQVVVLRAKAHHTFFLPHLHPPPPLPIIRAFTIEYPSNPDVARHKIHNQPDALHADQTFMIFKK